VSRPTNSSEKKRFVLFSKLFVLTGLTWFTGVISTFSQTYTIVWYIYIILNSSQGLFILFAFAFSPQTRKEISKSQWYSTLKSTITTQGSLSLSSDKT
jgi:hypothetical protein